MYWIFILKMIVFFQINFWGDLLCTSVMADMAISVDGGVLLWKSRKDVDGVDGNDDELLKLKVIFIKIVVFLWISIVKTNMRNDLNETFKGR